MSFEASLAVIGSVRVSVVAGSEAEAHDVAHRQVTDLLKPRWDILALSFARALRDDLAEQVRSLTIASQLEGEDLTLLVKIEPPAEGDRG